MRSRTLALVMMLALTSCKSGVSPVAPHTTKPVAGAAAGAAVATAVLKGVVKAISDNGAGVISNNGSSLISNNGGAAISDNGAGLGAGPRAERRVLATRPPERPLAGARVEVLRLDGRALADAAGHPIVAVSDASGAFRVEAPLPAGALLLRVALSRGGSLVALAPAVRERDTAVDTGSTLGARYLLGRLAGDRPQLVEQVPAALLGELHDSFAGALDRLDASTLSYGPDEMTSRAAQLRSAAAPVNAALTKIEAILLAGRAGLGAGLPATATPLTGPDALVAGPDGTLTILELSGRMRRVDPQGIASILVAGPLFECTALVPAPDGGFYLAARSKSQILRVSPAGEVTVVVGTGERAQGALGFDATQTTLDQPNGLALAADGSLFISEFRGTYANPGRLLQLGTDGKLSLVPIGTPPDATAPAPAGQSLVVGRDGSLYMLDGHFDRLAIRAPDGQWRFLVDPIFHDGESRLALAPDGALYLASATRHQVIRLGDGSARDVVAGAGEPGFAGDGGPAGQALLNQPAGLAWGPDGTLYVAERGNGTVRAVAPDGTIRTVAGALSARLAGDALEIPLNLPAAAAVDPDGRLVFAEFGGNTIRRLADGVLATLAGGGDVVDAGLAARALFDRPGALAYLGDDLLVADVDHHRIRRIRADGTIETTAGNGEPRPTFQAPEGLAPTDGPTLHVVAALAAHPSGVWCWADGEASQVLQVKDGVIGLVAGLRTGHSGEMGDGAAAAGSPLGFPAGLAYGADASLYISDLLNGHVLRIGGDGIAHRIAGMSQLETLAKASEGQPAVSGLMALETPLIAPGPVAVGPDGSLFIGEFGTNHLDVARNLMSNADALKDLIGALPPSPAHVWRIGPDGRARLIAGPGGLVLTGEGGGEALGLPIGLAIDHGGGLVIVDPAQGVVHRIPPTVFETP